MNLDYTALDDAALISALARARNSPSASAPMSALLSSVVSVLYDRYGRLVFTVAYHIVGDAESAEEITQDVFVRAWEGAHTYQPEIAKVSSWLVSIARHRAIDELRRRGARAEKDRTDWPEDIGLENAEGMPLLDGPEKMVESSLQQRGLRQIVAALPPEQRTVLALAYFQGLSHGEIAERLGEPLGTVKSRIRLAMHRLRDAMIERGMA